MSQPALASEADPAPPKHPIFARLHRVEDGVVAALFLLVIVLPVIEILLRPVIGHGIPAEAVIVQHFTFWAAFLGSMLCSREGSHLSLSTAGFLPGGRARAVSRVFAYTVSAAVTAMFAFASFRMVIADTASDQKIMGIVPYWWSEAVMPIALVVMTMRLVWHASPSLQGRAVALAGIALAFAIPFTGIEAGTFVWPLSFLIIAALLLGAPVYIGMCGLAMVFYFGDDVTISAVPSDTIRLALSPLLPAVPLLTTAGFVLTEGGAGTRLVAVFRALFGWLPGGLAVVVCCVCAIFTAFTGGSGVTILALGGLMLPMLKGEKYPDSFSAGLVTASGSLGLLFPPSVPVVLYAIVAQIPDMNALFMAGLVPCILVIALVCVYSIVVGIRAKTPRHPFDAKVAARALWQAKWELALPLVMGVSVLTGRATMIEASALACAYAIVIEVFVFKDIPWRRLPTTIAHAAALVGAVLIMLCVALAFTGYLVDALVPAQVLAWVQAHVHSQLVFLLVLNVALLVLGSVLEIYSAVFILAPLIAPLGEAFGVSKIHLAIVFLANLELGFLLPPVGFNLFLSASRFKRPLPQVYRDALPFLCIMTAGVLLVTYVPAMTTGMLDLFGIAEP